MIGNTKNGDHGRAARIAALAEARRQAAADRKNIKAPMAPEGYIHPTRKKPEPYSRFDWETSGSGIKAMNITAAGAANSLRLFLNTDFKALEGSILQRTYLANLEMQTRHFQGLPVRPKEETYAQLFYDKGLAMPVNRQMVAWVKENYPNISSNSSDDELAGVFDAFIRQQQGKNQRPKRGITSSIVGKVVLGLALGYFGGPIIGALAKGAGVPAGLLTAGKIASTGFDIANTVKGITGNQKDIKAPVTGGFLGTGVKTRQPDDTNPEIVNTNEQKKPVLPGRFNLNLHGNNTWLRTAQQAAAAPVNDPAAAVPPVNDPAAAVPPVNDPAAAVPPVNDPAAAVPVNDPRTTRGRGRFNLNLHKNNTWVRAARQQQP